MCHCKAGGRSIQPEPTVDSWDYITVRSTGQDKDNNTSFANMTAHTAMSIMTVFLHSDHMMMLHMVNNEFDVAVCGIQPP